MRRLAVLLVIVAGAVLFLVRLAFFPLPRLTAPSRPSADYDEALTRVRALQARDTAEVNDLCRTTLRTHGAKTARVIVLLHGYTSCPQMYASLADTLYERGYNVLMPRLPHHGLANRLTDDLERLDAGELVDYTTEVLDAAQGLGERVTVVGESLGGTLALWAAQYYPVDGAMPIAAMVAPKPFPLAGARVLTGALLALPNLYSWWDPSLKDAAPGPQYAYPRFSTRGLAQVLTLGFAVYDESGRGAAPLARRVQIVTNAADPAVQNGPVQEIADRWTTTGKAEVRQYEFPASLDLIHDMIDPHQKGQHIDIVYPVLLDLIDKL